MGIDAASCSTQSRTGLRQQARVSVLVLDFHPQDLEPSDLGLTDQLDIGEQRAVAAEPAFRAQSVRKQRCHRWTMAYRIAPRKRGGGGRPRNRRPQAAIRLSRSIARSVRARHPALRRSPTGAELREIATQQASRLPMPRGRASTSTSRPQSKACASQFFGGTSNSAGGALASTELTSSGTSVANSGSRLSRRACRAARFAFARAARCCSFWRLRNEVDPLADNRVLRSSRNWN